jgi:two-component system cell cycle sensor histidine kinase/response regulator CckA
MPDMNGQDLVKVIKQTYPNIKSLFMSGYTADIITNKGVISDGLNFLQKPFTLYDLANKIRTALDS